MEDSVCSRRAELGSPIEALLVMITRASSVVLSPLDPQPGACINSAIGLSAQASAPVRIVQVDAVATPSRHAVGKWQPRRFVAQKPLGSQAFGGWARGYPGDNADRVPCFFARAADRIRIRRHGERARRF